MSDLDKLQDAFLKADALAQQGDAQAKEDARMFAQEIRRLQTAGTAGPTDGTGSLAGGQNSFMGQVNAGIAGTLGGLVDFINPLDNLGITGSAAEGMKSGMRAVGVQTADRPPEGVIEGFASGVGNAAGALLPVARGAQALQSAPGMVGKVAQTVAPGLVSSGGAAAEVLAGGLAGASMEGAEAAGAPPWVQSIAGLVGGMAVPIAGAALARGSVGAARAMPVSGYVMRTAGDLARAVAPMSKAGAMEVAKRRVQDLAGGWERSAELAGKINPNDPLGRTPAQQTGDPNLLGLERAAADESPLLRERLASRDAEVRKRAEAEIAGMGGDVADAKRFFDIRLKDFRDGMAKRVDDAVRMGDEALQGRAPYRSETANSSGVTVKIKKELAAQEAREGELWAAIPMGTKLPMDRTRGAIEKIVKDTPWAQRRDVPPDLKAILAPNGPLGDMPSGKELHGLYSEMRRIARNAMAGTNQNKNTARIANEVADSILADMGALDGSTEIGQAINTARAYSRAIHETFDRGAVGRILQRTIDGDEAIAPEAALARTVGRGGAQGATDARSIEAAAPRAAEEVTDYLRGRYMDAVFDATGQFTPKRAAEFLRSNREMLERYPGMKAEFTKALASRSSADALAAKVELRVKLADRSAAAGFNKDAVSSILGAENPAAAARQVAGTARKDKTGKALAGVKNAFSDFLIGKAGTDEGLSGAKLSAVLKDPKTRVAMRQIFSEPEMSRIETIATALAKAEAPAANVGRVVDTPANRMLEYVVRVTAARYGGQMGGGTMGGSLQTANIAAERARSILRGLTNNRARQLLMDAQEDPELYKALLMSPQAFAASKKAQSTLAPYLAGTVAAERAE
jgi:hypothetical protein